MDIIHEWGIQIIQGVQALGEWLKVPMLLFSLLGNELFYLLVAPAIYWCWNPRLGLRLALYLMMSSGINALLKIAAHSPRPYWYRPQVRGFSGEQTFGLPSGHAQHAVVLWGSLGAHLHRSWIWAMCGFLILAIGISRISWCTLSQ